MLRTPWNKY